MLYVYICCNISTALKYKLNYNHRHPVECLIVYIYTVILSVVEEAIKSWGGLSNYQDTIVWIPMGRTVKLEGGVAP